MARSSKVPVQESDKAKVIQILEQEKAVLSVGEITRITLNEERAFDVMLSLTKQGLTTLNIDEGTIAKAW